METLKYIHSTWPILQNKSIIIWENVKQVQILAYRFLMITERKTHKMPTDIVCLSIVIIQFKKKVFLFYFSKLHDS